MRRGLVVAVLLCLGGAALLLLAISRTWLTLRFGAAPPLPGRVVAATGDDLVPGFRALALLGLAGVAALPATRSWGRLAVGVLTGAAALWAAAAAAAERRSPTLHELVGDLGCAKARTGLCFGEYDRPQLGLALAVLGSLLLLAAGAVAAVRGGAWRPAEASSYEAPGGAAPEPVTDKGVWDALDRGDDPTA
jgi:uncharacterized membrane protein (TIGR02234 family)